MTEGKLKLKTQMVFTDNVMPGQLRVVSFVFLQAFRHFQHDNAFDGFTYLTILN